MPIDLNQKIQEFGDNADRVDQWVNDPVGYTDKNGNPVDSIPKLIEDLEVSAQATAVFQARDEVADLRADVVALTESAAGHEAAAEVARDAAFVNADVYPTTADGRAAVAVGEQFMVVNGDVIDRYVKIGPDNQTLVATYPAATPTFNKLNILQTYLPAQSGVWAEFFQNAETGGGTVGTKYTSSNLVTDSLLAQSLRLIGSASAVLAATRYVETVKPGRTYEIRFRFRRALVPSDPVVNPVELRVRGLLANYAAAGGAEYIFESVAAANTAVVERAFTVSVDNKYANLLVNTNTVHIRPSIRLRANDDGDLIVQEMSIRDVSDRFSLTAGPNAFIDIKNLSRSVGLKSLAEKNLNQSPSFLMDLYSKVTALESELNGLRYTRTNIYADPNAVGLNDGSSWVNAYTSLKTALEAASPGQLVFSNSNEANPFPAEGQIRVNPGVTWCSNQGSFGETWITGAKKGIWTDEGSGIFSLTLATEPPRVAYDFKRDSVDGTITGVNLTAPDFARALVKWGVTAADCVAWYGFMLKEAVATTTPAEGSWSYTGGKLYINPPGSPVLADVNAKAIYSNDADGIDLAPKIGVTYLQSFRHYGKLTVHFTPHISGSVGYSLKSLFAQNCSFEDIRGIASGNHMLGLAGASGTNNTMRNCIATGGCGTQNPYVFRTNMAMPNSGHVGDKLVFIVHPYLKTDGSPLRTDWQSYSGNIALSHGGGLATPMGGVLWSRLLQINVMKQIADKLGTTTTPGTRGAFVAANFAPAIDRDNLASISLTCVDSLCIGTQSGPSENIKYINTEFDVLDGTQGQFSFNTANGPHYIYLRRCVVRFRGPSPAYTVVKSADGLIDIRDTEIGIDNSAGNIAYISLGPIENTNKCVRLKNNTYTGLTGSTHLIAVPNLLPSTWLTSKPIESLGGNTFINMKPVRTVAGAEFTDDNWRTGADLEVEDVLGL